MKLKYLTIFFLCISILSLNVSGKEDEEDQIIKVGVYESDPYYDVDEEGCISGYYHDLLLLLQEKYAFPYEYIICDFSEGLEGLKEKKLDIMLGVSVSSERLEHVIYNQYTIATEKFGLFANDEKFCDLIKIKKAKVGLVEGSMTVQIALDYFKKIGIELEPVYVKNWPELEEKFKRHEVDIIPHNIYMEGEGYYKLLDFTGDQVYIAASKNNKELLRHLDEAIMTLAYEKGKPLEKLYASYFEYEKEPSSKSAGILVTTGLFIIVVAIFGCVIDPKIKNKEKKERIRGYMKEERYLLQYQPIYNPRNKNIVGFEGLLRRKGAKGELVSPSILIPEIEKSHMLYEVSLWILKKAIEEYQEMSQFNCVKNRAFYISINVSLKEIENIKFVQEASQLLEESGLGPNKICLEIVEKIKVKNLKQVSANLKRLKEVGFKIAIDDFGTEYSNLDRLLNLDTHIIKIDRSFIEGMDQDLMKNEIVTFVSSIAEIKKKEVVLEGIERESEALAIQKMNKELIYVQGYYYNKPLFKEQIKNI